MVCLIVISFPSGPCLAKSRADVCFLSDRFLMDSCISAATSLLHREDHLNLSMRFSASPDNPRRIKIDAEWASGEEQVAASQRCKALILSGPSWNLAKRTVGEIRPILICVSHHSFAIHPIIVTRSFKGATSSRLYFSMRFRHFPKETGEIGLINM